MNKIPEQYTGVAKDVEEQIQLDDLFAANDIFLACRNRMLNINEWEHIASGISASFHLTDRDGNAIQRLPAIGDHISINVPASGSHDRYDWVVIEEIQEEQSPDRTSESVSMQVRPCADPKDPGHDEVKHFFSDAATSTFLLSRVGKSITAGVYSRNEKPNVSSTENISETLRNTFVALGAMIGFSNIQWKSLVEGILDLH